MRLLFLLLLLYSSLGFAQIPTQTLRGTVSDAVTYQPLSGADLRAATGDTVYLAITDDYGVFVFENLPVGRYTLSANYVGYRSLQLPGVLVQSGAPTVQAMPLERGLELSEVTVSAGVPARLPMGTEAISIEQVQRFPATFYDPARLAASYAGVINTNDQSNGLSIRGNSPASLQWRLEGVEIVNPNHTPNAGTTSDRATLYGGGVNILSAQLLGTTELYKGPFPARFGNVTGGVLDMRFRNADPEAPRNAAQVSLLGFDLATERRLFNNSDASIIANARYSFTGLLAEAGVDFGGEEIRFADLALSTYLPVGNDGAYFKLFGVYGRSSNRFRGSDELEADDEPDKNLFDIDFESSTSIAGGSYVRPLGTRTVWSSTLAYSYTDPLRRKTRRSTENTVEGETLQQTKLALHTGLAHQLRAGQQLRGGLYATRHRFDAIYNLFSGDQLVDNLPNATLFEAYAAWEVDWTARWRTVIGVSAQYYTYGTNNTALEPRLRLEYRAGERHRFTLAYSRVSQLPVPFVHLTNNNPGPLFGYSGRDLGFQRAHHASLGYELFLPKNRQLTLTAYYQYLYDAAIDEDLILPQYLALNQLDELPLSPLVGEGLGENIGLEISFQQRLRADWYYLINGSVIDSRYGSTVNDRIDFPTRFDVGYLTNATVGKEWATKRAGRLLGVNARLNYSGGLRTPQVDLAASRALGATVLDRLRPFATARTYFRTDLRAYWKLNHPKRTTTLALDIQNVTNTENFAFAYYDSVLDAVVEKNQLGLIPNLTYRVEW